MSCKITSSWTMLNKVLYSSFFFAVLCPCRCYTETKPYKHLGCFTDTRTRAVPKWLGYIKTNDVQQCADKASEGGYPVFALQIGYECRGGYGKSYNKYGTATNCDYGGGGDWANDVYQFTDEILWPKGTFSLLKPSSGCPSDLIDNGWLLQDTVVHNTQSPVLNIDGYVSKGYVVRYFCTKTARTSPQWPKGQYCIYKEGDRNAANMKEGRIKMIYGYNEQDSKKMTYKKGIVTYYGLSYFNFYCQTNGIKSVPIDLPISQPFYLLPYGSRECQQVKWMVATKEWIQYGTRNYQTQKSWRTGTTPYIEAGKNTNPSLTMFYCYYATCNQTLNSTQGAFKSPRYPENYPDGQLCSWRILVPVNHTVLVHFIQFHLSDDSRNDTDVVETHRLENKSFVLSEVYKGYREPFKVSSTSDLLFVFRSNEANSSQGFHAKYKVYGPEPVDTSKRPSTTTSPTTIQKTTNPHNATTGFEPAIETKHEALTEDSKGTMTILLIVIPLVCFILIAVVAVDIYFRCRSKPRKTKSNGNLRSGCDHLGAADNLTYDSPAVMRMANFKSTTTIATTDDNEQQDTDKSYERLSHIAPRREIPEQYDELNRSSQPSSTNHMPLPENDPDFYHVLERPNESVDDETMYQVIDKDSCEDAFYERNVLYDNVA